MTITTTSDQATRVSRAFGAFLQLERNATENEIKVYIIAHLRGVVQRYERGILEKAAQGTIPDATPFDPT